MVLLVSAVMLGRSFMGDEPPVTAASTAQTPVPPMSSEASAIPAPKEATDDAPVFAGHCSADESAQAARIKPSRDTLRATAAAFQEAYFARDVDGVRDIISNSNKDWKDQDWGEVFDSLPANTTYCLTMPAMTPGMSSTTATLTMTTAGQSPEVFKQKIYGTSQDGKWSIRRIDPID